MADKRISDLTVGAAGNAADSTMVEISAAGVSYSLTLALIWGYIAGKLSAAGVTFSAAVKGVAPAADDSSATLPTTAWFMGQLGQPNPMSLPLVASTPAQVGTSTRAARFDHQHPVDPTRLAKAGDQATGAIDLAPAVAVAAAATTVIGAIASNFASVSGAATITAFDSAPESAYRMVRFASAGIVLVNSATLALIGGANITTQAGDHAEFRSLGAGLGWRCKLYQRADGTPLTAPSAAAVGAIDTYAALVAQQGAAAQLQVQLNLGVLTPGQVLALAQNN